MAAHTVPGNTLHPSARDLSGMTFGRLTAIEPTNYRVKSVSSVWWRCRCECGNEPLVAAGKLTQGRTRSCGCLLRDTITKHGASRDGAITRTYRIWCAMKNRCSNTSNRKYARYGGRGIHVCERWQSFTNFFADMGECPDHLSLERIDNSGDYSPDNCRWATQAEQTRNMSRNRLLTLNGETLCVADWAIKTGLRRSVIQGRINRGWPVERMLTEPPYGTRHNNKQTRFITHDGVTQSLAEWAHITGLSSSTILARLRLGWPIAKALTQTIYYQHGQRGK